MILKDLQQDMEKILTGKCVYILKTGKNLYKIGKTQHLQRRLSGYRTHLPVEFRVVRQYMAANMDELEQSLHVVFQHKHVKGEWFELATEDLQICDNIARSHAMVKLQKQTKKYREIQYSDNPLLQVMEANEKYLTNYSKIVEDIKLGLTTNEIMDLNEGAVSKTAIETVRKLLKSHTPNSQFISQSLHVVSDLEAGMTEKKIVEKYRGSVSRATIQTVKRILHNQLY
ncbi:GIY-YIG nuclease family protein [Nafulsella turpanensis]|uniref:GIY-YIG nuclease family protein n=1 Tax=Nafulsella turpanensis TaxID=1265690 RepID=UPI00034B2499|nr:GIY-YIG nuclease family protein [Nafulsella turpanensis]